MQETLKDRIIKNVFFVSKQPVLFRDLLEANALFNEGMLIDGAKLNFRFNHIKLYQIYALICFVILFPLSIIDKTFQNSIRYLSNLQSATLRPVFQTHEFQG